MNLLKKNGRKSAAYRIIAAILVVVTAMFVFVSCGKVKSDYSTIDALIERIQEEYYQDISKQELIEAAIKGMFTELDPYSMAYTYEEYASIAASNAGQNKNYGFSIRTLPRRPVSVARVTGGGPAEEAGLKAGDEIIGIKYSGESNYQSVEYLTQSELITLLTNPSKPKYSLKVNRIKPEKFLAELNGKTGAELYAGLNDPALDLFETVELKEMEQKEYSVKYVYYYFNDEVGGDGKPVGTNIADDTLLEGLSEFAAGETGYIRLTEFSGENTVEEFGKAMDKFKLFGKKRLILDLRDNPGGNTVVLAGVASYLIFNKDNPTKTKIPIFNAKFKNGDKVTYYTSSNKYQDYFGEYNAADKKITVLVNGMSASASEALSSAIVDYNTGTLVGTTTYKKGIMQTTYNMTGLNYYLKLTVATFYSAVTDITLHDVGLTPTGSNFVEDNYYACENSRQLAYDAQFLQAWQRSA